MLPRSAAQLGREEFPIRLFVYVWFYLENRTTTYIFEYKKVENTQKSIKKATRSIDCHPTASCSLYLHCRVLFVQGLLRVVYGVFHTMCVAANELPTAAHA